MPSPEDRGRSVFRLPEPSSNSSRFRIKGGAEAEGGTPEPEQAVREPRSEAYLRAKETHEATLVEINELFGGRVQIQKTKVEQAASNYEALKAAERREPVFWRAPFSWIYLLLLAGLALAEVPINRLSFELFFAEDPQTLVLVAILVGVVLMALAHPTGLIMRRYQHAKKTSGATGSVVALTVLIVLIVGMCYGISIFRQAYLNLQNTPDASLETMVNADNFFEAAAHAWSLNPTLETVGWIFLAINLGIICIGVFFSFFRHDPHPSFEQLHKDRDREDKALESLIIERDDRLAAERGRFAAERRRKQW